MPVFLALANPYRKELKHENNLRPVHHLRGFRFCVLLLCIEANDLAHSVLRMSSDQYTTQNCVRLAGT